MIQEPSLEFPAIRLQKSGRVQFIASWSLKTILMALGSFAIDSTHGSGLRINHPRVRAIAKSWLEGETIPAYSPVIIAIDKTSTFAPLQEQAMRGFGMMTLPFSAIIDICDGVHRVAALQLSKFPMDQLRKVEWPVEFVECNDETVAAELSARLRGAKGI